MNHTKTLLKIAAAKVRADAIVCCHSKEMPQNVIKILQHSEIMSTQ